MRKRTVAATGILFLILGFLLGTVVPPERVPWSTAGGTPVVQSKPGLFADSSTNYSDSSVPAQPAKPDDTAAQLNPSENFPLLNAACAVVRILQQQDYQGLSSYVHPDRGLTLTPYSTVSEEDLSFTPAQVAAFGQDGNRYTWGTIPGTGELLQMTPEEFFALYIFNNDYTQSPRIGVDRINISGNALENVAEAYPGCRFVEFSFPGTEAAGQGQDWSALKLVFVPNQTQWQLVGVIHSQWTV